jgi:hypothetical protein
VSPHSEHWPVISGNPEAIHVSDNRHRRILTAPAKQGGSRQPAFCWGFLCFYIDPESFNISAEWPFFCGPPE